MQHVLYAPLALVTLLIAACAATPTPHPLAGKTIAVPAPLEQGSVDLPRFPSMSPDGSSICFSWRGDLWRVDAAGGQATRLTAHPGQDDQSVWSPDGSAIAFNSERSGFRNVYRMNADGTNVVPITSEDRYLFVHGWSSDGAVSLTGYLEADANPSPRPYTVAATGGEITRLHDAFGRSAVVSPDGRYVAFVRGRARWNRPFNRNSNTRDLWLFDRQTDAFRQLTENPGNDGMPRWLDDDTLIYLSARAPARVNVYRMDLDTGEDKAVALTDFAEDDVQHIDVSRESAVVVIHVWDRLYTLDLNDADASPKALAITAPTDTDDATVIRPLQGETQQAALSPDGKVMAMSIHGELFIRTVGSKDPPQRITQHPALDHQPVWSPDGRVLYFVSDRTGTLSIHRARVTLTRDEIVQAVTNEQETEPPADQENEEPEESKEADVSEAAPEAEPDGPQRWHSAIRFAVEPVVVTEHEDSDPSVSPDGKTLALRRGNGAVVLVDLANSEERLFHEGWDSRTHWTWSADSRYLALCYQDQDHNADIWVGPVDGSAPLTNVTKHPASDVLPSFSHDGKILTFVSNRHDGQYDVFTVYLDKALETYTPQQLADYYKQAKKRTDALKPLGTSEASADDAKEEGVDTDEQEPSNDEVEVAVGDEASDEPTEPLDLADAYLRLRRLTNTDASEWSPRLHPSGGQVVFERDNKAYRMGMEDREEKKIGDQLDVLHLSLTGSHLIALRNGTAVSAPIGGGEVEQIKTPGSIRADRQADQAQRFRACARAITMSFYDASFKGIDWDNATEKYGQLASRTWTPDEFDDVANRYLGLLDASHMGIRSPEPSATNSQPSGRLGATYRRSVSGYEVVAIEPKTPAALGRMRLRVGDVITAIDFKPIEQGDTVSARLVGKVDRETVLTIRRTREPDDIDGADEPVELHLLLTPISYSRFADIRYSNWHLANRARVDEWSKGRLGYIHIESMNESSLADFERDLYAACAGREGLIVDVRDNGGGWTTDRLLASIMTQRHAYTVPRDADPGRTNSYPNTRLFIPRYNLPMNALCNENSFSNAEIFSHAFKTLGRGTLVGNTTAGGVISTGSTSLLDGTRIRLPFRGWYLPDGTDMENNGAVPDLSVPQSPQDEAAGNDAQLEAAVKDLMKRLDQ